MTRFGRVGPKSGRPEVEYAEIVSPRKRWLRKHGKWLLPSLLIILAGAGWGTEHFYLAPARDEHRVAQALQVLELNPAFKSA